MDVPEKIQKEIKKWAKEIERSPKDLMNEVMAEAKEGYLKQLEGEKRFIAAWRAVRARLAKVMQIPTKSFLIHVVDKTDVKEITTKNKEKMAIANAWGLIQAIDDADLGDQLYFMKAVGMRDGAKMIDKVECGKAYEIELAMDKKEDNVLSVSFVDKKSVPKPAKPIKSSEVKKAIKSMFETVDIADASFKVSESPNDLKIIEGNVVSGRTPTSQKGFVYGRYTVVDDSMDLKSIKESGGLRIMCDASQIKYADGSDIMVIGVIETRENRVSMRAECIIDILGIPRRSQTVEDDDDVPNVKDELVDEKIKLDDDEPAKKSDDEDEDDDDDDESDSDDEEEDDDEDSDDDDDEDEEPVKKKAAKSPKKKAKKVVDDEEEEEDDESEDEDEDDDSDDDDEDIFDDDEDEDADEEEEDEDEPPKKKSKTVTTKKPKKKMPSDDDED